MSTTLFVLVVLQGANGLTFSPGYTTAAECMQQYRGPNVACFAYDPSLTTWTAFFNLPAGGFRTVGRINSEDECKRYIGAFKDDVPAACRQLAIPATCSTACRPAEPPPVNPPPPDPASIRPDAKETSAVQLAGGRYEDAFRWVEDHSVKDADKPFIDPRIEPTKPRRVARRTRKQFDPFQALVSFLTPRDW